MLEDYTLKMNEEEIELSKGELADIVCPRDFSNKYLYGNDRLTNSKRIEGEHFWVSGLAMSSGHSLKRNQKPVEVVAVIGHNGVVVFCEVSKTGDRTDKIIRLYDGNHNGLHVCKTKRQAEYMYNKDIEDVMAELNRRISTIVAVKKRVLNLEQKVSK